MPIPLSQGIYIRQYTYLASRRSRVSFMHEKVTCIHAFFIGWLMNLVVFGHWKNQINWQWSDRIGHSIHDLTDHLFDLQVLADQAVWAVCGRAAAVIDMSSAQRQTINVEVMPLVGGHLALPKVRLSKYIVPQEGVGSANQNDKRGEWERAWHSFSVTKTIRG